MSRDAQKCRSEQLKQQILDTALCIGLEEGFEALSVRKIIQRMQYSTSIIYYHFKNKQEIIDALIESESAKLGQTIRGVLAHGGDARAVMERAFRKITDLAVAEPEKYNLIVLRKYSSPREAQPQWMGHLQQQLADAMAQGTLRPMDAQHTAFSIWSSFLGFHLMLSLQRDLSPQQVDEMFATQMDVIFHGICAP